LLIVLFSPENTESTNQQISKLANSKKILRSWQLGGEIFIQPLGTVAVYE